MLEQNAKIHELTGVSRFHAAGYTGKRVAAATGERINGADFPGKFVKSLVGDDSTTYHSRMTASVFFEVAPDAKLYGASSSCTRNQDGSWIFDLYDKLMPEFEKLGVTVMFTSMISGSPGSNYSERVEKFMLENDWFTSFVCAGNDSSDSYNGNMRLPINTGVAAWYLENGKIIPAPYSSEHEEVDFSAPTNIKYEDKNGNVVSGSGTSAATPYLCGMAALVQDFFVDKTGRPLKRDALLRFFRDNCVDLETPGHDNKTGCGAVVLPDPAAIDIWKYQDGGEELKVEDFKDAAQISKWAKEGIQKCLDAGIMDGVGNGMFDPKGEVTREQLATVAARLMEVLA